MIFTRSGWDHEWGWAFSHASTGSVLLCFLLAGLVASDRARRCEPTFALLARTAPRGKLALFALPLAAWCWGILAWAVGMLWVGIRAWSGGANGVPDPWIFVEPPVLMLMGAFVGLAAGSLRAGLLTGPLTAIGLFLLRLALHSAGLEGTLEAGGAVGSLIGWHRSAPNALAVLGFHLSVLILAATVCVVDLSRLREARGRRLPWRSAASLVAAAAVAIGTGGAVVVAARHSLPFRGVTERVCIRQGSVSVCGPPDGREILTIAARSLAAGIESLNDSGIAWQREYLLPRGGTIPASQGILVADTEGFAGDTLGRGNLISTLVQPRLCLDTLGDAPMARLRRVIDDQSTVSTWLEGRLGTGSGSAPSAVREAYQRLRSCVAAERLP